MIMIDPIESREVRINGVTCHIALYDDPDSTAMDADCYSAEDIACWLTGHWGYVTAEVRTTFGRASVSGVEYGCMPHATIGLDSIVESHGRDLLGEAYGVTS